jgi:hypothetical protein
MTNTLLGRATRIVTIFAGPFELHQKCIVDERLTTEQYARVRLAAQCAFGEVDELVGRTIIHTHAKYSRAHSTPVHAYALRVQCGDSGRLRPAAKGK